MILFVDLKTQYNSIRDEIKAAIDGVLESNAYVLGKAVSDFERDFAAYCETKHAVALNSGTAAIHLALLAHGIGRGDEVITVPNSFFATAEAISLTGAKPVFVDVDEKTCNIDVSKLEKAVTSATKAILPVHLYGQPCEMDALADISMRKKILLIEDACQAHGARYRGRRVGGIGDAGCFSFYPGKNLGAYGEGGAVTTNDDAVAARIRMLRDHGSDKKYHHAYVGLNYRMEGIQGAVLGVKLRYLDGWNESRRKNAAHYDALFKGIRGVSVVSAPSHVEGVYHLYVIKVDQRDAMQKHLGDGGIQTGIHYPIPIHLQKAYEGLKLTAGSYPVTERISKEIISLPMFPELKKEEREAVVKSIKEFLGARP